MTKAIHQIDFLIFLLGKIKRVQALMGTYFYNLESEDQVVANLEFESGALASLCVSGQPHFGKSSLDFIGKEGSVCLPWKLNLIDKCKQRELEEKIEALYPPRLIEGGVNFKKILKRLSKRICARKNLQDFLKQSERVCFLKVFVDGLSSKTIPVPVSSLEARQAIEVCAAIYTSAIEKSVVDLPLNPKRPSYQGIKKEDYDQNRNT